MNKKKTIITAVSAGALAIAGTLAATVPANSAQPAGWMLSTTSVAKAQGEDATFRYVSAIYNDGADGKSPLLAVAPTGITATFRATTGVTFKPGAVIALASTAATPCTLVNSVTVTCHVGSGFMSLGHGQQYDVLLPATVNADAVHGTTQTITQQWQTDTSSAGQSAVLQNILVK